MWAELAAAHRYYRAGLASSPDSDRLICKATSNRVARTGRIEMIENRELTVDDYLAILRRRMKIILIPTLVAPLLGFLVSYVFPAKYTSTSLVQVEDQQVPGDYVKPVVTEDLSQRIASLQQQVLSRNELQPMINR